METQTASKRLAVIDSERCVRCRSFTFACVCRQGEGDLADAHICALGTMLGISDAPDLVKLRDAVEVHGLDAVSTGVALERRFP